MGYPISAKAIEIAHNLANNLLQRGSAGPLATLNGGPIPVTELFDTNGLPCIEVGALPLASAAVAAFIQVAPYSWPLGQDVLGNAAAVYTPTVIRVAVEAPPTGVMQGADIAILQAILGEADTTGCRVELWNSASGTAPSDTTFNTASNLVSVFENFQYPLVADV
jgi:hypothetical protein